MKRKKDKGNNAQTLSRLMYGKDFKDLDNIKKRIVRNKKLTISKIWR